MHFNTIGTTVSPRLSFIVKPVPAQAIRLTYNRAYRAPTQLENYLDTLALSPGFDRTLAPCDPAIGCAYNDQLTPSTAAAPSPTVSTPLEFRTIEGSGEIFFKPTSAWDLSAGYRVIDRDGTRPKAFGFGGFGGSNNNYINVAAPIEERTHHDHCR